VAGAQIGPQGLAQALVLLAMTELAASRIFWVER